MSSFNNDFKDAAVAKNCIVTYPELDAELNVDTKNQFMQLLSSDPRFEEALAEVRVHNGLSRLVRVNPDSIDVFLKRIKTSSAQVGFVGWLASCLPFPWCWGALRDYILPESLHPHLDHIRREAMLAAHGEEAAGGHGDGAQPVHEGGAWEDDQHAEDDQDEEGAGEEDGRKVTSRGATATPPPQGVGALAGAPASAPEPQVCARGWGVHIGKPGGHHALIQTTR